MGLTRITSDGITDGTITGTDLATNVDLVDNQKLRLGTGNDLEIYHDGSNSYLINLTGDFILQNGSGNTNQIRIRGQNAEESIVANGNGSVDLYYDNSKILETKSTGLKLFGSATQSQVELQTSDGTTRGFLYADNTDSVYILDAQSHVVLKGIKDGAAELYHDNNKKLETDNSGVSITGRLDTTTGIRINADSQNLKIGSGDDLQLYHDGTDSIIANATGDLYINNTGGNSDDVHIQAADDILLRPQGGENGIKVIGDGAVELYHNNIKTFQTSTHGCQIFAPEGGSAQVYLYADEGDDNADLWGFIASHTASKFSLVNYASGSYEDSIVAYGDGAVELYNNNQKKLNTRAAGIDITGDLRFDTSVTGGIVRLADNQKVFCGSGDDLQIYHDGSNSYVSHENGSGHLYLQGDAIKLRTRSATGNEDYIVCNESGDVELYYNNSIKFETTSDGTKTTGSHTINLYQGTAGLGQLNFGESGTPNIKAFDTGNHGSGSLLQIRSGDGETHIECNRNGNVELYYDNSLKFETISTGIEVNGTSTQSRVQLRTAGANRGAVYANNSNVVGFIDPSDEWHVNFNRGSNSFIYSNFLPSSDSYNLGSSSYRWGNVYTNDLHLSNEGHTNDVDGTWGSYTIQEGEESLFLINKRNGKKYKFNLTEVS